MHICVMIHTRALYIHIHTYTYTYIYIMILIDKERVNMPKYIIHTPNINRYIHVYMHVHM